MSRQDPPSQANSAIPLRREDRDRFRNWLIPLSAQVEQVLLHPGDMEAQANVRKMLLDAMSALAELEQREGRSARRREAEIRRALRRIRGRLA